MGFFFPFIITFLVRDNEELGFMNGAAIIFLW